MKSKKGKQMPSARLCGLRSSAGSFKRSPNYGGNTGGACARVRVNRI